MHYSFGQTLRRLLTEARHVSPVLRPAQYFLLVSQERTGSTLLSTLLSFHPEILMDLHVFYTPETWPAGRRPGRLLPSTRPVRGFKFKTAHAPLKSSAADATAFFRAQTDAGVRILRLQRHNLLRQALSAQMVGRRNELHAWRDDRGAPSDRPRVEVDVPDLLGRMEYFDRLTRFQEEALDGIPHLPISYEADLLPQERHQETANRVFRALGLSPAPVETRLRKLTSNDLSSVITNLTAVEEALRDTPYARFLAPAVPAAA